MAHRISKLLQQLIYRRRPVFCPFLQSVRLESSLHPNHPNPIPEDFPDELESWKDNPSRKIRKYYIRKLERQILKEKYPHSFIEERLPFWYPWWTSCTREQTPRDPLVLPRAKEDLKYTRLAQFAISEYNKKENAHLEFVRV